MSACHAKQYSDRMSCDECALLWDVNDPHPPACRYLQLFQKLDEQCHKQLIERQTRLESLVEVNLNIFLGWLMSMLITMWIVVPLWKLNWSIVDSFWVTMIYTVSAIIRGYFVRRFFDAQLHKIVHKAVKSII